ncbi:hypothetical protein [Denitratisoma oestradiolicum]|nr:hypothetical protein [Denitratisoma oestradiolicum]
MIRPVDGMGECTMVKAGFFGLLVALMTSAALAQESDDSARRLVEQKLRLVETLTNSPAARQATTAEGEVPALIGIGRQAIADARVALAQDQVDQAAKLADEALKAITLASRRGASAGALPESVQRRHFDELREQVTIYRASADELVRDGRFAVAANKLLAQIDRPFAEADSLAAAGRLGEANKKLSETYRLAVAEISRLRAGQEVVLSLKFDTPADEYAYEQKRFNSNEIMVDMMIAEGRGAGGQQKLVDGFLAEGRKIKLEAEEFARTGRHKEAVGLMERAAAQLVRALQAMGVPVF